MDESIEPTHTKIPVIDIVLMEVSAGVRDALELILLFQKNMGLKGMAATGPRLQRAMRALAITADVLIPLVGQLAKEEGETNGSKGEAQ